MRGVWELVRRDARHVRANAIALVVFVGIVAVPSFYAWFNIAGSWDPYGNTATSAWPLPTRTRATPGSWCP